MKKVLSVFVLGTVLLTGCGHETAKQTSATSNGVVSVSNDTSGQFATPKVAPPPWLKLITLNDVKGLSFAKSPAIGQPNKQTNSLLSTLVETLKTGTTFEAHNVAYPGTTWQITIWLKNGQAIGITPILRSPIRNQPPIRNAVDIGPGPGPPKYPLKHNEYAVVYLQKPSSIGNGANWMQDNDGRNQVVYFEDPSLSIQKMVKQLTKWWS